MKLPNSHRYAVLKNWCGRWVVLRYSDLATIGSFATHPEAITYAQAGPHIAASL